MTVSAMRRSSKAAGRAAAVAAQLDQLLERVTAPDETAAVLLEPVLGEGGVRQADPVFVEYLRQVCDQHGMLWISDEVQTGAGRTGKWWGYEHFGVEPDVVVFGKGVASGYPLAGVASHRSHFEAIHTNGLGGTYNGNVVATAAANATIEVIQEDDLVQVAQYTGSRLAARLRTMDGVLEVRQYGLMVAAELALPPAQFEQLLQRAQDYGLMLLGTGVGSTLRLLPPLNIQSSDLAVFYSRFEALLAAVR